MRNLVTPALLLCFWLAWAGPAACFAAEPSVLDQRLEMNLSVSNMPLRQVLGWIDVRMGRGGYVIFGLELAPHKASEPRVTLNLPDGVKLEQVLMELVRQAPAYGFEVGGPRLVNIYPKTWRNDPENILKVLLPRFDIQDVQAYDVLTRPWEFIPVVGARMFGPYPVGGFSRLGGVGGPKVSLHLRNVTVRQILNHAAQVISNDPQEPRVGWLYTYIAGLANPSEAHRFNVLPSPRGHPQRPK